MLCNPGQPAATPDQTQEKSTRATHRRSHAQGNTGEKIWQPSPLMDVVREDLELMQSGM